MQKYKVSFQGFAYVEAENEEDAIEQYEDGNEEYKEAEVSSVELVDEFIVEI